MFRTQNLCPGSKNVFDSRQKHFLFSEQQNLFPQHMFPAQLNWETFASATMFPSLARPLASTSGTAEISVLHVRHVLKKKSVQSSAKQQRGITTFPVLMKT